MSVHLALTREALAPLLHPESLWSYLWTDADTQRVSDALDDAYGHEIGSALWTVDALGHGAAPFTCREVREDKAPTHPVKGEAWILVVRKGGARGREGDKIVIAAAIRPNHPKFEATTVRARLVTLKAWREAHNKAEGVAWPRRIQEAEVELRAKHPDWFAGRAPPDDLGLTR